MITIFNQWLKQSASIDGLIAAGVRYQDKTFVGEVVQPGFERALLEHASNALGEAFQMLRSQKVTTQRLRLTFEKGLVHGIGRTDGHCLCLITPRELSPKLERDMERLAGEFLKLWA